MQHQLLERIQHFDVVDHCLEVEDFSTVTYQLLSNSPCFKGQKYALALHRHLLILVQPYSYDIFNSLALVIKMMVYQVTKLLCVQVNVPNSKFSEHLYQVLFVNCLCYCD